MLICAFVWTANVLNFMCENVSPLCLSLKGELMGSCKDFRINNFTMDEMGLMRLGSSHAHFLRDVSENQHDMSVHAPPVHFETGVGTYVTCNMDC